MDNEQKLFELDFKNGKISVQCHLVNNQTIYRIVFSDKRAALVITKFLTENAPRWWTSIPEGRQKEAEEIGPLIAQYIKLNQL
jgi:hypothetical protein